MKWSIGKEENFRKLSKRDEKILDKEIKNEKVEMINIVYRVYIQNYIRINRR